MRRTAIVTLTGIAAAAGAIALVGGVRAPSTLDSLQLQAAQVSVYDADSNRVVKLTPAQAIDKVRSTLRIPQQPPAGSLSAAEIGKTDDLTVEGPIDGAFSRYYKVSGQDVAAIVDVNDGHLLSLLLPKLTPASTRVSLSAEQAVAAAVAFANAQSITTDGLVATATIKDRGVIRTYQVTWQKVVNGVTVPDSLMVEMDATTGVVFRLNSTKRQYSDPPAPVVSQSAAFKLACTAAAARRSAAGVTDPDASASALCALDGADLAVTFAQSGAQTETWSMRVAIDDWHYLVTVDAINGSASVMGEG